MQAQRPGGVEPDSFHRDLQQQQQQHLQERMHSEAAAAGSLGGRRVELGAQQSWSPRQLLSALRVSALVAAIYVCDGHLLVCGVHFVAPN